MTEEPREKILIIATHGPEDPERATFPFVIANASLAMDVHAVVVLQGTAVLLAQREIANHVFATGLPPLGELFESFFAQEGELLLCSPCVKGRQIDPELLIDGVEMSAAARVVQESLDAKAVLNY